MRPHRMYGQWIDLDHVLAIQDEPLLYIPVVSGTLADMVRGRGEVVLKLTLAFRDEEWRLARPFTDEEQAAADARLVQLEPAALNARRVWGSWDERTQGPRPPRPPELSKHALHRQAATETLVMEHARAELAELVAYWRGAKRARTLLDALYDGTLVVTAADLEKAHAADMRAIDEAHRDALRDVEAKHRERGVEGSM